MIGRRRGQKAEAEGGDALPACAAKQLPLPLPTFGCLLLALAVAIPTQAASVSSLDDIQLWVGDGANRAALAVDWFGDTGADTALVWGYRWDGAATGEDMLRAVAAADERFFARVSSGGPFGIAVFGLGYDENDSGGFALDNPGVVFGADGLFVSSPSDDDSAADPADRYREGWFDGYWHYARGSATAGLPAWSTSGGGPTSRALSNGDWDSYAFALTLNSDEFAENLIAAESVPTPGDFNGDGFVDAADYTVWRDTIADPASYLVWKNNFGAAPNASGAAQTTPEPATAALLLFAFATGLARPARVAEPLLGRPRRRHRRRTTV